MFNFCKIPTMLCSKMRWKCEFFRLSAFLIFIYFLAIDLSLLQRLVHIERKRVLRGRSEGVVSFRRSAERGSVSRSLCVDNEKTMCILFVKSFIVYRMYCKYCKLGKSADSICTWRLFERFHLQPAYSHCHVTGS